MASDKVFVYGTLKRNQPAHHQLMDPRNGTARFLGNGHTSDKLPLVVATKYQMPFLLNRVGLGQRICGEVYEADEQLLTFLDKWEKVPELYDRRLIKVTFDSAPEKGPVECYAYITKTFPQSWLDRPFVEKYDNAVTPCPITIGDLDSIQEMENYMAAEMKRP